MSPLAIILMICLCQCDSKEGESFTELYNLIKLQENKFNRIIQQQEEKYNLIKLQESKFNHIVQQQEEKINQLSSTIRQLQQTTKLEENERTDKRLLLDDPSHLQFEIDQLNSRINSITKVTEGAVYTRWGKKTCPTNGTELVYFGYAGGSYFRHTGGAAEYICLPPDPVFGIEVSTSNNDAYIYGSEYQTSYFGQIADDDVPCAVCRSQVSTNSIMIPGKEECYAGWKKEYNGRLASGYYAHAAASQYVCVDGHPDVLDGSQTNLNGKLFYGVRAVCGSLPCPPYHDKSEFLCVVCSK